MTVAEYLLPRWLVALRAELPGTAVTLTSHNTAEVVDDVRSGDADLGFVEGLTVPGGLDEHRRAPCPGRRSGHGGGVQRRDRDTVGHPARLDDTEETVGGCGTEDDLDRAAALTTTGAS